VISGEIIKQETGFLCLKCKTSNCKTCDKCSEKITSGKILSVVDKSWHADCFTCVVCDKSFEDNSPAIVEGKLYHKECHFKQAKEAEEEVKQEEEEKEEEEVEEEKPDE